MTTPGPRLSEYVVVDTSSARADRLWRGVRERLEAPVRPARRWALPRLALLALCGALAFAVGLKVAQRPFQAGWAKLETAAGEATVRLQDGSALTLAPKTSLGVREPSPRQVELALELGRVQCDVTPRPERSFSVHAAGHQVLVKGTRFSVDLSRERNELAVEVQSGQVEIRRAGGEASEALLGAGQRWSVRLEAPAAPAPPDPTSSDSTSSDSTSSDSVSSDSVPPDPVQGPRSNVPEPSVPPRELAAGDASAAAPRAHGSPAASSPGSRERGAEPRRHAETGARSLLDRGNAARRAGDLAGAAQAYEQLLREYPSDARVGLAAFELGRLRMDQFQDVPGAVSALTLAIRVVSDAGLREDATARLVRAFEILKDGPRCRAAREQYLEAYPTGTHVVSVASACTEK